MKAQHVWAAAATMVGVKKMGTAKQGGSARHSAFNRGNNPAYAGLLALILLMVFAVPLHAQTYVAAGDDLEAAVAAASDGDVLVLEGDPAPVVNTIDVSNAITIRGYDVSPCENLPTDRVIGGLPDSCFDSGVTNLNNPGFEAGPVDWNFPAPSITSPDTYPPPTINDIITEEGEAEEGTWHAVYELDPRGAPLELQYQDPIPTLPQTIEEEVRWDNNVTNLCDVMDLTTESPYTLPVLPPTLVENFHALTFPVTLLSDQLHIWLEVLQWSGNPDDQIEVFVNGVSTAVATGTDLDTWQTAGIWTRWDIPIAALPVGNVDIRIEVTTRTDVANPTLVLMGAVEVNDVAMPMLPTGPDAITRFD